MSAGSARSTRSLWSPRSTRSSAYDLYVAVMILLVVVAPAVRAVGLALAAPRPLALLLSPRAPATALALLCAAAAVLVIAGGRQGPAVLPPFLTATLASGPDPRRIALRRPLLRSVLLLAGLTLCIVLPVGIALAVSGTSTVMETVLTGAGALGLGALLAQCWLAGELLGPAGRGVAAGALTALAVVIGLLGSSAIAVPLLAASTALAVAVAVAVAVAAVAAVAAGVRALDLVRGSVLREQALRRDRTTTIALSADLVGVVGELRDLPSIGRALPAVGAGPLPWIYLRRDVVAWSRTPQRSLLGALLVLAGSSGIGLGASAGSGLGPGVDAALLLIGAALLWWGSGAFVDGIRHAVHTLGAPTLLGQTAGRQVVLHSTAPILLLAVAAAATSLALGAPPLALLLVPLIAVGRVRDAAKGPLPLALMTPMPTVQGDFSVLLILGWQLDALLLTLLAAGAAAAAGAGAGMLAATGVALGATVILAAMAALRIRRLRR